MNIRIFNNIEENYNPYFGKRKVPKEIIKFHELNKVDYYFAFIGFNQLIDYCTFDSKILNKEGKLTDNNRDNIRQLISYLTRRTDEFINIHSNTLKFIGGKYYKEIIKGLIRGTNKGSIIECDNIFVRNIKALGYRIVNKYNSRKVVKYLYSSPRILSRKIDRLADIEKNKNNFMMMQDMELSYKTTYPSIEFIKEKSKKIVGYNHKGKERIFEEDFCNKYKIKRDEFWDYIKENKIKVSSLDRDITYYEKWLITENGVSTPLRSREYFRIYTSFNRFPKWIREEIIIDGEKLVETDMVGLHPNIIASLYKSQLPQEEQIAVVKYLEADCHSKISNYIKIKTNSNKTVKELRTSVKKEFLSFFNVKETKLSSFKHIYNLFETKMPTLLKIIKDGKKDKKYEHKATCRILLKNEAIFIENCMKRLHRDYNIQVYQCFDALYSKESDKKIVVKVMNDIAKEIKLSSIAI